MNSFPQSSAIRLSLGQVPIVEFSDKSFAVSTVQFRNVVTEEIGTKQPVDNNLTGEIYKRSIHAFVRRAETKKNNAKFVESCSNDVVRLTIEMVNAVTQERLDD